MNEKKYIISNGVNKNILIIRIVLWLILAATVGWLGYMKIVPSGQASYIYDFSRPFIAPFAAVFQRTSIQGSIFEWTTILAMFVYWLLAIAIVRLFLMSKTVSIGEAAAGLEAQEA